VEQIPSAPASSGHKERREAEGRFIDGREAWHGMSALPNGHLLLGLPTMFRLSVSAARQVWETDQRHMKPVSETSFLSFAKERSPRSRLSITVMARKLSSLGERSLCLSLLFMRGLPPIGFFEENLPPWRPGARNRLKSVVFPPVAFPESNHLSSRTSMSTAFSARASP